MKNKLLLFCVFILYALQSFSQTSVVGKSQNYVCYERFLAVQQQLAEIY